jgi:hypothetical protein
VAKISKSNISKSKKDKEVRFFRYIVNFIYQVIDAQTTHKNANRHHA